MLPLQIIHFNLCICTNKIISSIKDNIVPIDLKSKTIFYFFYPILYSKNPCIKYCFATIIIRRQTSRQKFENSWDRDFNFVTRDGAAARQTFKADSQTSSIFQPASESYSHCPGQFRGQSRIRLVTLQH